MFYGIKTGLSEAFIINEKQKEALIEKDKNSQDVIRPYLTGRDISRYGNPKIDKYILFIPWHFPLHEDDSISGASKKAEEKFKEDYSAVYEHLKQYETKLKQRNQQETGIRYEWYALQRYASTYLEEFFKPKIIYQRFQVKPAFLFDNKEYLTNDACYYLGSGNLQLLAILNSKLGWFLLSQYCPQIRSGYQLLKRNLSQVPIIKTKNDDESIIYLVKQILTAKEEDPEADTSELEEEIDQLVYELYGLTEEEIGIVEESVN